MTQGLPARAGRPDRGCPAGPARRHRRGDRPAAGWADADVRLRSGDCSATRDGRDRFGLADRSPRRCATCRTSRATSSTRRSRAATSASRPAPRTRRWRCTRSATSPASASARSRVRWSQLGFGRTSTTSTSQSTPRNLFGFKDGTLNVKAEETADVDKHVWVAAGRRPGLAGRRLLPGRAPDQHAHRDLGPAGPAARRRRWSAGPRARARRCRAAPSSPRSTWP